MGTLMHLGRFRDDRTGMDPARVFLRWKEQGQNAGQRHSGVGDLDEHLAGGHKSFGYENG